jgi:uncharacterized membrane protein YgcG
MLCIYCFFCVRTRFTGRLQAHVLGGRLHLKQTSVSCQFVLVQNRFKNFSCSTEGGGGGGGGSSGCGGGGGGCCNTLGQSLVR